jgi:hypothetical protein
MAWNTISTTAEILNGQDQIRVTVTENDKNKKKYIDVRRWFKNADGEWQATSKGIMLPIECGKEVMAGIKKALEDKA